MLTIRLIAALGLVAIGCYIGFSINRVPFVTLSPNVSIAELGNFITVLVLAFMVPVLLTSRLDTARSEKDLLIGELEAFSGQLEVINTNVKGLSGRLSTKENFIGVLSDFKSVRAHFLFITEQLKTIKCKQSIAAAAVIEQSVDDYWCKLTGTPGFTPNGFLITPGFVWEQSKIYDELARAVKRLKFSINNR